jgi:hypothetical protein
MRRMQLPHWSLPIHSDDRALGGDRASSTDLDARSQTRRLRYQALMLTWTLCTIIAPIMRKLIAIAWLQTRLICLTRFGHRDGDAAVFSIF